MRDLVFKNITSLEKKRKILASYEIADKEGVRSIIRRHFICIVREINDKNKMEKPQPHLYVLKERNRRELREKFFCKIKGSVFAINNGKLFLIQFMHTLSINLIAIPKLTTY